MKTKHLFWGFLLITIGVLILLNNVASFTLYWFDIGKYWPLLLILIGISLLIKSKFISRIVAVVVAIIIGISVFAMLKGTWGIFENDIFSGFRHGIVIKSGDNNNYEERNFTEDYNSNIKTASLKLKASVGSFSIEDTTSSLFAATTKGYGDRYHLSSEIDNDNAKLIFRGEKKFIIFGKSKNKVDISLNRNPLWKLNFDIGAAATEFDLRPFKVRDVDVDMGAASLKIYLGDLSDTTNVEIEAGASSIEISVPENSGCEVKADVTLSSKHFDDFNKIGKDLYRTDNFYSSSKKIFIKIDSGVSSVRIRRLNPGDWL